MKLPSLLLTPLLSISGLIFLAGWICLVIASSQQTSAAAGFSAPTLFNQGNSYAREGKLGLAIASYERAKILDPTDPNITANLNWVREKAALPTPAEDWLENLVGWASPNTWAWMGCGGLILIGTSFLAQIAFSRTRLWTFGGLIVGFAFITLCLVNAYTTELKSSEYVVVTPNAKAYVAPATNAESSFNLNAGQQVNRNGQYQDFILIADSDGHTGWVKQSEIIPILP
jgi:hypothetical protein